MIGEAAQLLIVAPGTKFRCPRMGGLPGSAGVVA